jgi:hypothetical protein
LILAAGIHAQDAREIVRKSVDLDQTNYQRMRDYTWSARATERHFGSGGEVKSEQRSAWETVMLGGEPYRRMLERDNRQLTVSEQGKEQERLDKIVAKLAHETQEQRSRRLAEYDARRKKERDFLREIPDAYDLRIERETEVDGRPVWIIAGVPRAGYNAKDRDAKALWKIRGELWVDQATYQWVRLEAETTETISYGLFLARLSPGARLVFEQMPAADGLWLPKRLYMKGAGRLGLLKRIAMDEEITWSNYHKFQVTSKILPVTP